MLDPPAMYKNALSFILTMLLLIFGNYWCVSALDVLGVRFSQKHGREKGVIDYSMFAKLAMIAKILTTSAFAIIGAEALGFHVTTVVAGLGVLGVGAGLASKDLVENLFGGVVVALECTFSIGDWIKVGGIEGNVVSLGFRNCQVRQGDQSLITVPNALFINSPVTNFYEAKKWRLLLGLVLPSDLDPDKIEQFVNEARELLGSHPLLLKGATVFITGVDNAGIKVDICCFTPENPNDDIHCTWAWMATFNKSRQAIILDLVRLSQRLGITFAVEKRDITMRQAA
eukprot:NODE_520_length_1649_cov_69.017500_g432_i0.p2 GENE.NODE_520_length_1649_cov_69.017500_g432_i0~~NODE_520_length_1649_cov_69.017500_g432_i0.p2  ORF type:complete len:285 (-),score=106.79 NODE_520_length_1649_cov_69.017500_g432_i0:52-906(-)